MKAIIRTSSEHKSVKIMANDSQVMAFALQDGEFWFTIGRDSEPVFRSIPEAIAAARTQMGEQGYTLNEQDISRIL